MQIRQLQEAKVSRIKLVFISLVLFAALSACGDNDTAQNGLEYDELECNATEYNDNGPADIPVPEEPYADVLSPDVDNVDAEVEEDIAPEDDIEVSLLSHDEMRELLNSIPYAGMNMPSRDGLDHPVVSTETAMNMAGFIANMSGWWGWPSMSFYSPEEADPAFVFAASFMATNWVQWHRPDSEVSRYHPELAVLAPYLDPDAGGRSVKLHNHIKETARNLFGVEIEIHPSMATGLFAANEYFDVYHFSLEAFGFGGGHVPVVLSYEYIGGGYEVICVFAWVVSDQYVDLNTWNEIPDDELIDHLHTLPRHTITLKRNQHGGFYYWAHILPEE